MKKRVLFLIVLVIVSIYFFNQKNNDYSYSKIIPSTIDKVERQFPEISARSYAVVKLDGEIVFSKNINMILPIASITKLVTAVVSTDLYLQNFYKDLFYPLLLISDNQAGEDLANLTSRHEFILKMNSLAKIIGAHNTNFSDPTGLSPNNISTAKDIALISAWIYKNKPEIFEITKEWKKTIGTATYTNKSHFLQDSRFLGGKSGYIPEAGQTSVALFEVKNEAYIIVILNSKNKTKDTLALLEALE